MSQAACKFLHHQPKGFKQVVFKKDFLHEENLFFSFLADSPIMLAIDIGYLSTMDLGHGFRQFKFFIYFCVLKKC